MFRRLILAAATASATSLIPALTGHGHAATLPPCATAASRAGSAVLPITPAGDQQVRGVFCYSIQYREGGFALVYQARIAGLRTEAQLRVTAVLHPSDRLLDLRVAVYQPGFLLDAQAGCGCITPAVPHPPVGPLAGVQVTVLSGSRDGEVGITQALALQARSQTQAAVGSTSAD
jgi:hypothetical protein